MWVSTLKKWVRFRISMGLGPAQVSAQDGLRHKIGFGSERFQFELSFGPRRVLARGGFWIGTGRFGSGSGRHGFPHGTGFGSQRVLGRHEFPYGTGFRPTGVSARDGFRIATGFRPTRVSARDGFRIATGFRPTRFQYFQFFFCFVSVCFRLVGLSGFVSREVF
ncbi:hypothetical protein HanHA300_Chr07g0244881 [Helianthus annuus]|nr:hypothetical protein HanHA300_Chr07g0244881 [Helianthus annuus]KAJ0563350.1 hypothetical protein HanHA89_Chr07g0262071 [Helianthus annuus]